VELKRPIILADTRTIPAPVAFGFRRPAGSLGAQPRRGAVFANLFDPKTAEIAHRAGEGAEISLGIGAGPARRAIFPSSELHGRAAGRRQFRRDRSVLPRNKMQLGRWRCCGSAHKDRRRQPQAQAGSGDAAASRLEPAQQQILALKSSVHFRADFQPIGGEILIVAAPGANPSITARSPTNISAGRAVDADGG